MRTGGGGSVAISADVNRLLGRVNLIDGLDPTILGRVAPTGFMQSVKSGYRNDWHLRHQIKRIIYRDACENAIQQWDTSVGAVTANNTRKPIHSPNVYQLLTGNVAANSANMYKHLPNVGELKMRMVVDWAIVDTDDDEPRHVTFSLAPFTGGALKRMHLRYLHHSGGAFDRKWAYEDILLGWTDIATGGEHVEVNNAETYWQRLEVDMDFTLANCRLLALRTNALDLGPLAYDFVNVGATTVFELQPSIEVTTDSNDAVTVAIGYVGIFEID